MHASWPPSANLSGLNVVQSHLEYFIAYRDIEVISCPELTKVSPKVHDAYRSSVNKRQADNDAKVTNCFKQTIRSMSMSSSAQKIPTSPLTQNYTLAAQQTLRCHQPNQECERLPPSYVSTSQRRPISLSGLPHILEKDALAWFH